MIDKNIIRIINEEASNFVFFGNEDYLKEQEDLINKFWKDINNLMIEIEGGTLTFEEAHKKANLIGRRCPANYLVETRGLNKLMKETYGNEPDWEKYYKTIVINVK